MKTPNPARVNSAASCTAVGASRVASHVNQWALRLSRDPTHVELHVYERNASRIKRQPVKGFSRWVTRGRFLTSASKFNIEPNGGIFDVSVKKRPRITQCVNPLMFAKRQGLVVAGLDPGAEHPGLSSLRRRKS